MFFASGICRKNEEYDTPEKKEEQEEAMCFGLL